MFDLDYLVDNGTLRNWQTVIEPGCDLVQWTDDGAYSVLDALNKPLGWGYTADEAISAARMMLTERKRLLDEITPAKVC